MSNLSSASNQDLDFPKNPSKSALSTASTQKALFRNRAKIGSFIQSMAGNDPAFLKWLLTQIPPGGTITEFLIATAIDAYNEDLAHKS